MELSSDFLAFLENTGIRFAHRNQENIALDNLFVYPDLKWINGLLENNVQPPVAGEDILKCGDRIVVLGDEQSGKTTLAKRLFLDAMSSGLIPVLIKGQFVKNSKIEDKLPEIIAEIYSSPDIDYLLKQPNLICIVDDISECKLNKKAMNKFIEALDRIFPRTILLAEETFGFVMPDFSSFDDYAKLEILPLGNVRRSELIEKWIALDLTEEYDEQLIFQKIDDTTLNVNALVLKNVVPPKPIYILMLLQSFETITPQRLELTSYGHCYQHLIYQSLERANVRQDEVDTYLNVLTELGGVILEYPAEVLGASDLDNFFANYSKNFLPIDREKIIKSLLKSSILLQSEHGLQFRYRYLFYFFAAKKLSESLHKNDSSKDKINNLVGTIHLEKSSNIVLFLTHHSKDPWVLEQILFSVMEIFSEEEEATLSAGSLSFLKDFIHSIPELVLENRQAKQERLALDKQRDISERHEDLSRDEVILESEPVEFMMQVNKVFRSIEVCGQILRNRLGSLERDSLELIVEESLSVSLRFVNLFVRWSNLVRDEAIRDIQKMLDQNPNLSDSKIAQRAESLYLALNYFFILAMLRKTAMSLGSVRGREVYLKVAQTKNTPATLLIQEIIELQFEKKIDFSKIEKLHSDFSGNPLCDRLLKHILICHCYMHDIGYQDRQRLASKLHISMQAQRSINLASRQQKLNQLSQIKQRASLRK